MSAKIREALMHAAITCKHHITAGEVRLEHDSGEPGPTALGQMANRLERAFDVCAAPMVGRITVLEAQNAELLNQLKLLTEKGTKQETGLGWNARLKMARAVIAKATGSGS